MFTTQREDVSIGTHHDAIVAEIGRYEGEKLLQAFTDTHRASTRATTAMRRREGLVQVDMHYVKSHITRATGAEHRVQISTVIVHQTTCIMHHLGYLWDVGLKEAKGIRIGHHHGGDVGAL